MVTDRVTRLLGVAGAVGGLGWAALPVVAALAFYGIDAGAFATRALAGLGALFTFAAVPVALLLVGVVGLHRALAPSYGRLGSVGTTTAVVGLLLLMPAGVVPRGSLPTSLAALVPLGFFVGLVALTVGSGLVGYAGRRSATLPAWLGLAYAAAMPVGFLLGLLGVAAGAGNLALVLGLLLPYGLAWVAMGAYLATGIGA